MNDPREKAGGAAAAPVPTTLVIGPSAQAREAAIVQALLAPPLSADTGAAPSGASGTEQEATRVAPSSPSVAILLEGLPAVRPVLPAHPAIRSVRIAPGCVCCTGNLVMQVSLNRLLRPLPGRLFIALADTAHLAGIRDFLSRPPYDALLALTPDLHA